MTSGLWKRLLTPFVAPPETAVTEAPAAAVPLDEIVESSNPRMLVKALIHAEKSDVIERAMPPSPPLPTCFTDVDE
jgi:hypothetical protein